MKLRKKLNFILATIIASSAILLASATAAHAKANSIVVLTNSGSYYEYNYADLKSSAVASILGDTVNSALYDHFLQNKASIKAYYDDVRNVYVPASAIYEEATNCVLGNKPFDFKSYMESQATPSTPMTTTKVQDDSGTITPGGDPNSSDFDVDAVY